MIQNRISELNQLYSGSLTGLTGSEGQRLLVEAEQEVDAVPTMFSGWNDLCHEDGGGVGLGRGWHVLIGARTGTGKSVIGLNMAYAAVLARESVFFVSLEMSRRQVQTRYLAIATATPVARLEQGSTLDRHAFRDALADIEELEARGGTFLTNAKRVRVLDDMLGTMLWAHEYRDCRYFVVDYIQLAARNRNDPVEISEVSDRIRLFAADHNVITVCLSQFNRETSKNKDRPDMYGLMGSSSLENDADQIALIDHSRVEKVEGGYNTYLILGKNRHGSPSEIAYHFNRKTLQMWERT